MSLWIPRRDKTGRLFYYVVEVPLSLIVMAFGICTALLLGYLATAPVRTLLFCFGITLVGFVLFAIAKLNVVLRGRLVSFGSGGMSGRMRAVYRLGWVLMTIGTTLTLFCISFVSRS